LAVEITERLARIRERVDIAARRSGREAASVRIIGASKTMPPASLEEAVRAGLVDFGENRVQEALPKMDALAAAGLQPTWHFIGHLQSNKARVAAARFAIIHSVDTLKLAEELNARSPGRLKVLLEVNVANEASKSGFTVETGQGSFDDAVQRVRALSGLNLVGLMTVAPHTSDEAVVRSAFRSLAKIARRNGLSELSMGMTEDFEVAIEEGATMVRIGRAIFGERNA
jgi:pyridoxal phosphate enzyme (YggS family)